MLSNSLLSRNGYNSVASSVSKKNIELMFQTRSSHVFMPTVNLKQSLLVPKIVDWINYKNFVFILFLAGGFGSKSKDQICHDGRTGDRTFCQRQRYAPCQRKINAKFKVSLVFAWTKLIYRGLKKEKLCIKNCAHTYICTVLGKPTSL